MISNENEGQGSQLDGLRLERHSRRYLDTYPSAVRHIPFPLRPDFPSHVNTVLPCSPRLGNDQLTASKVVKKSFDTQTGPLDIEMLIHNLRMKYNRNVRHGRCIGKCKRSQCLLRAQKNFLKNYQKVKLSSLIRAGQPLF